MFPEKPPLDELTVQHFGVKGMHWGTRKQEVRSNIQNRSRTFGNRSKLEFETAATLVGVAALGLAFANSPRAQSVMKVPASAAVHYMSDKDHRRKVGRVLKKVGVFYYKL